MDLAHSGYGFVMALDSKPAIWDFELLPKGVGGYPKTSALASKHFYGHGNDRDYDNLESTALLHGHAIGWTSDCF